jgi:hypothetical protein
MTPSKLSAANMQQEVSPTWLGGRGLQDTQEGRIAVRRRLMPEIPSKHHRESQATRRRFAEACRKASVDPKLPPEERERLARMAEAWERTLGD